MRSIFIPLTLIIILLELSGCGTSNSMKLPLASMDDNAESKMLKPNPGETLVYFFRTDQSYDSSSGAVVLIDGVPRRLLNTGTYFVERLKVGNHNIEIVNVDSTCQGYKTVDSMDAVHDGGDGVLIAPNESILGGTYRLLLDARDLPIGFFNCENSSNITEQFPDRFPDSINIEGLGITFTEAKRFLAFGNSSIFSDSFNLTGQDGDTMFVFIDQNSGFFSSGGFTVDILNKIDWIELAYDYDLGGQIKQINDYLFMPYTYGTRDAYGN